jgi:LemA protein
MSPTLITVLCIAGAIALFVFWLIAIYNGLVVSRNQYKNAYAQIDVQLKRRYDLIPNLIECVKGYMAHEKGTLDAVIQARNSAFGAGQKAASNPGDPEAMANLAKAEGQLGGALGRLIALSEAYPDLKANQNMMSLQEELSSTENKVGFARQAFNDAVLGYNNARGVFPAVMVAGMFGFTEARMFEVDSPEQREAPKVAFN